jgi:putative nucleotidyltransferase with HDIG domain
LIYIPLNNAQPGMVLAKSIPSSIGYFSLLKCGEVLTAPLIDKLREHGIDGVYVEFEGSEDIEPACIMEPEVRQQITAEFRKLYTDYFNRPAISSKAVESTRKIAETIVDHVLSRDEYLVDIMEIKCYDNYTYSHSLNVGILSILLASEMGIDRNRLEDIGLCALMHDIGKVDIPIQIINKNGPVTDSEFAIIKTHPEKGVERLRKCYNVSHEVLQGVQSHHEKVDGTGYPYGYKGSRIPMFGRILAVSDVYDALTSQRSYRAAWLPNQAIEYIIANSDTQFDRDYVGHFMHIVCAYPAGTVVQLSDGSPAVVVRNFSENVLRPEVRLLESTELGKRGTEINLFEDREAFHLTVKSVLGDSSFKLPSSVTKMAQ